VSDIVCDRLDVSVAVEELETLCDEVMLADGEFVGVRDGVGVDVPLLDPVTL
jgi:hypothetical protein